MNLSIRTLHAAGLLALAAVTTATWSAPGPYVLTDLGDTPVPTEHIPMPRAINSEGVVVGEYAVGGKNKRLPFASWGGTMFPLGSPLGHAIAGAQGINDAGHIVGDTNSSWGESHAWVLHGKTYTDLGTLGYSARATGISNDGHVVGWSGTPNYFGNAFIWYQGVMRNIHPYDDRDETYASGISPNGRYVVGSTYFHVGDNNRPFIYQDGAMTLLDANSGATAVNDGGVVVGGGQVDVGGGSFEGHPVMWLPGGDGWQMHDLGMLGEGNGGSATAINVHGQVVGWVYKHGYSENPFIWDEGQMWPLRSLVTIGGEGWVLLVATAINARGQITGVGRHDGVRRAFLLTPVASQESVQ